MMLCISVLAALIHPNILILGWLTNILMLEVIIQALFVLASIVALIPA